MTNLYISLGYSNVGMLVGTNVSTKRSLKLPRKGVRKIKDYLVGYKEKEFSCISNN